MNNTRCFLFHIHPNYRLGFILCNKYVTATQYQRYFEGGVSSVFLWDLEDGGFAGVVLLKKSTLFLLELFIIRPAPSFMAMIDTDP